MERLRGSVTDVLSEKFACETVEKYEEALYAAAVKKSKITKISKNKVYAELSYEKLGQIMEAKTKAERKLIMDEINKGVNEWESNFYSEQKEIYKKLMDKSVAKPKAVKGIHRCKERGCDSDEFYVWAQQDRSGDEASSQYRQCAKCGKRRKE